MARTKLRDKLADGLFLLDGAMGTQLIAHGIEAGKCNDYLNIESPDIILDIHKAYIEAGSDAVITNTFGANRFALARHGLSEKSREINLAGAQTARKASDEERYVLGDIGPSGDFLEPLGAMKADELKQAFFEQAKALLEGGVDGFIIETMTAIDELKIAVEAVKELNVENPVFASMAFDKAGSDYRTMMGVDVDSFISEVVSLNIEAIGFNCGTLSLEEYVELAGKVVLMIKALSEDIFVYAEPNAGKPELIKGKAEYKVSPEDFASETERIHSAGVTIIGGCCGTGPKHIEAVAKTLKK